MANATIIGESAPDSKKETDPKKVLGWMSVRKRIGEIKKQVMQGVKKQHDVYKQEDEEPKIETSSDGKAMLPPSTTEHDDEVDGLSNIVYGQAIDPPFDLETLCILVENSNALRQNTDAMATNIDAFGHRFEPVLDFTKPTVTDQIRELLMQQKAKDKDLSSMSPEELMGLVPSDEEVEQAKEAWEIISSIEKGRAESFFKSLNPIETFTDIRMATREELELLGNSAWEVIRENPEDPLSPIAQVYFVPFMNVRLIRSDSAPRKVKMRVKVDPITYKEVDVIRYFRRFVRASGRHRTFYKDFGDDRVVSRASGRYFDTIQELRKAEGKNAMPASEMFHFKIRSSSSPYGVPRWIGALISVLGSRASEEVNYMYFDNKAIPPMALLVSGGRLSESSVRKIESYVEDRIKGRKNFHDIMIIEALPADAEVDSQSEIEHPGKMRIELVPLFGAQQKDALFQEYDENNQLKVGRSWRIPQILTGKTDDMNRSTAITAKGMAEEQVFQPPRDRFDGCMDLHFMSSKKIRFWKFKTNAPVQRFPNDLVRNVVTAMTAGAMTPNEARVLLSDAFSQDFPYRPERWAQIPPQLAKIIAMAEQMEEQGEPEEGRMDGEPLQKAHVEGEILGAGYTSFDDDHKHPFVAVFEGSEIKLLFLAGGDDNHVHEPVVAENLEPGYNVELMTTMDQEGIHHQHSAEFGLPMDDKQLRSVRALRSLNDIKEFFSDIYREAETAWLKEDQDDD